MIGASVAAIRGVRIAGDGADLLIDDGPVDVHLADGVITDIAPTGALPIAGETIDGDGAFLIPGLWDHHVHTTQWALVTQRVDLGAMRSAAEAARRMGDAAPLDDGRRVGTGYRPMTWPDAPDLRTIDECTGTVPTYLINADVHSVWLNSAAFAREGIAPTPDGVLREEPAFEISRRLNDQDPAVVDRLVAAAAGRAAARGVVGIVDFDMTWNADAWRRRVATGFDALRVRFGIYPQDLDRAVAEGLASGDALSDLVTVGSLKVITDGSLGTRTAACSCSYPGDLVDHGLLTVSADELHELLWRATGAGISCAVHAIGDTANAQALDAFARTGATGTIEHAQLVAHADLARFARLGVAASLQPQHAVDDRDAADLLWATQTSVGYPMASLTAVGATVLFGSDAPVAPLDPWIAISAAVERTDDDRPAWHPEEAVSTMVALRASSARGSTDARGVVPGAPADLVLCGENPLVARGSALRTMPVVATLLGGRVTHG